MYHLVEKRVDADAIRVQRRRCKGGTYFFKIITIRDLDLLCEILEATNRSFLERRFGANARGYVMDADDPMNGRGPPVKFVFCMVSIPFEVRRGRVLSMIEQGRLRVSFLHHADGVAELEGGQQEQAETVARLNAERAEAEDLLADFLD